MRRCASKFFKLSKKVVRAQSGNLRETTQVVRHAGFIVDHPHNPGNASQGTWLCGCSCRCGTLRDLYRVSRQFDGKFLARQASSTCEERRSLRGQRSQSTDRREPYEPKRSPASTGIRGKPLEKFGRIRNRETPVPRAMLMPATKTITRVAQQ
ncbi:MAG: hypothetical protein WCA20_35930 [Candidatus Sulfotelmatobacter sp.]